MLKITTLSDKKVLANNVGMPTEIFFTLNLSKGPPQLKHLSANALWTTLHFLHSLDIILN